MNKKRPTKTTKRQSTTTYPANKAGKMHYETKKIKEMVGDEWIDVLSELAPNLLEACENVGKHVPCPVHGGKDGFRLFPDAEETGAGVCNTCGSYSDGFALLQWVNDWTFPEALAAVAEYLGLDSKPEKSDSKEVKQQTNSKVEKKIQQILDDTVRDKRNKIGRYLKSRGLSGTVPPALYYHPALPYYEDRKKVGEYEAMVAMFTRMDETKDGEIVSLMRTYLAPDAPGKADVNTPKKMHQAIRPGAIMGAAIRLAEPEKLLGFAEGIETALAVQEAVGTSMWATGSANGMEAVEVPDEVNQVEIWCDNDTGGAGQKAGYTLMLRLLEMDIKVKLLLPPNPGKDWLDVLNEHGPDALKKVQEEVEFVLPRDKQALAKIKALAKEYGQKKRPTPGETEVERVVAELNQRHFIVDISGRVCIGNETQDPATGKPDLTLSSPADFRLRYRNYILEGGEDAAEEWLNSPQRRQYKGVTFSPGKESAGFYNMFSGFPIVPIEGDCSLYWEHLRENICNGDEEHYRFLRKWMAHCIQLPGELPGTGLVMRGLQGTGKGIFVDHFGKLFGHHYITVYRLDQITGRFNGHLKNVLLIHANEAIWGGDKVGEGVLKGIITDHVTPIEYKGKEIINVPNYKRLIVATNETWAVPMGMDDRRFLVLEVGARRKEDKAYFGAIVRQMNEGGLEALMHDLLNEDLTDFDPRTAPFSRYNFDVKLRGAKPHQQWWYERLCEDAEDWDPNPTKQEIYRSYMDWCKEQGRRPEPPSSFGKSFLTLFPDRHVGEVRQWKTINEPSMVSATKKRVRCYDLPSLAESRKCYETMSKSGPEIWPVELPMEQLEADQGKNVTKKTHNNKNAQKKSCFQD